jgi:hypothetical protein
MLDARIVIGRGSQRVTIPCHELRQDNVADHILGYIRMNAKASRHHYHHIQGAVARKIARDLRA